MLQVKEFNEKTLEDFRNAQNRWIEKGTEKFNLFRIIEFGNLVKYESGWAMLIYYEVE